MPEIHSERRHRRDRVSRFWKQRSGGLQKREREVMRGFGVEREKKRAEEALVNHLWQRIIRWRGPFESFAREIISRCKTG